MTHEKLKKWLEEFFPWMLYSENDFKNNDQRLGFARGVWVMSSNGATHPTDY